MSDKLSFLDGEQPEVIEDEVEVVEVAAEPEPEIAEEPKGVEETAPPAVAEEPKVGQIPISALLDERDRRKKAEREAEELRQRFAAQPQPQAPDLFQDPEQRLAYEGQRLQQTILAVKLDQSKFLAERDFGADVVNEAYAYFDQNPQLSHQLLQHPSPFHAAVEFYKKQKVAAEIGNDPDAWRNKQIEAIREQVKAELMAEMQTVQPTTRPRLPGSLATAPASGKGGNPTAKGSGFDAAFG